MAVIKLNQFGGLAPKSSPRLLNDTLATTASDVNLESGRIVPIKQNSDHLTLSNSNRKSVFKYTDSPERWLQFDELVDVVRSPIPGDTNKTVYWSGQAFPKMGRFSDVISGSVYPNSGFRLGIPAPTSAPTVAAVAERSFDAVITFTANSSTITVTTNSSGSATAHSASVGEYVELVGFATTQGVDAENINGTYRIKTVPSTSTLTVELSQAATGSGNSSSSANGAKFGANSEAQLDYDTSYVYTFVSAYGEEGPPSAASTVITTDDNMTVNITNLETSTSKSNVNFGTGAKKRIYRSNTGSNTTEFQFVGEVAMSDTSFTDSSKNSELAEVIPSTTWIAPPDDDTSLYPDGPMKGLIALQNGIFAGFTGNRICFSFPYQPHAWPADYRIGIEEQIVSMKATSNGLIVGTESTPYLVTGSDPSAMVAIKIETAEACLSRESMVDGGEVVVFAGPDGLMAAQGAQVQNLTEALITPAQWQANYYPSTIKGFYWQGRYLGFFNTGSGYGGFIYDGRAGTSALTNLSASNEIQGGFTDPDDNEVYLIIGNKLQKFQGSGTDLSYNWKSKEFVLPKPTSFGFAKVDAEDYPVRLKVYGDGSVIYDATIATNGNIFSVTGTTPSFSATDITTPLVRLPSSINDTYAFEVISTKVVNEVVLGDSIAELKEV
tara:strand:- start:1017 stop:3011 length:1995 start_codon:yes stop_codon:yes gene_type:complete